MAALDLTPFTNIIERLEGVASRLEGAAGVAPSTTGGAQAVAPTGPVDAPLAIDFDAFLATQVKTLESTASDAGNTEVTEATADFLAMIKLLRSFFAATDKCAKPKDEDWQKILAPMVEVSSRASKACDNRSDFFSHRKAVAEAMQIMLLPTTPSPPAHVQATLEAMEFHGNKVLMKKIPEQSAWMKALKAFMKELAEWCKENCKMGITWKVGGTAALEYFTENPVGAEPKPTAAPAASSKGKGKGPPPPKNKPPPPDTSGYTAVEKPKAANGGGMADVFAAINNFSTGGLKKVTDDMKTKNRSPDDKPPEIVPKAKPAAVPKAAAGGIKGKGPRGAPILELQKGTNWMVENQEGGIHTLDDDLDQSHLVCIINCKNTTVKLNKKVKNVCIDGCMKVSLLVQDVLSSVEFVNSDRCVVQTIGKVNSFAIDKCDGVMIHLSKESVDAEFTTAKSSEMNVTIPGPAGDEDDRIELPIPEQFVTKIAGKKLETRVSDLYS